MTQLHRMKEGTTPQPDEPKDMDLEHLPDSPDWISGPSMIIGRNYPEETFDFVKLPILPDRMRRIPDDW